MWLVVAAAELGILLTIAAPANPDKPGRAGGLRTAAAQLRGSGPPVDLVQDYVGARDVAGGREAYPVLTRAYASVGLKWPAGHRSTHPPTAFLLVLPVAWLPWKAAAAAWMALMLAALAAPGGGRAQEGLGVRLERVQLVEIHVDLLPSGPCPRLGRDGDRMPNGCCVEVGSALPADRMRPRGAGRSY